MKTKNNIDCIKLKSELQEKINTEFNGIPDKEKYQIIFKRLKDNPLLNKLILSKNSI